MQSKARSGSMKKFSSSFKNKILASLTAGALAIIAYNSLNHQRPLVKLDTKQATLDENVKNYDWPKVFSLIHCDDNSLVYLLGIEHPSSYGHFNEEKHRKYYEICERSIETINYMKKCGVEEIVLEGFTTETFSMIKSGDSMKMKGEAEIKYLIPIIETIIKQGWTIKPAELKSLQDETDIYSSKLESIKKQWENKTIEEVRSLSAVYGKRAPQSAVEDIFLNRYGILRQDMIRYLNSDEGYRYFEIAINLRNARMNQLIHDSLNRGKKVALFSGHLHTVAVSKVLDAENIPYSLHVSNEERFRSDQKYDRNRFIEDEIPKGITGLSK